MVFGERNIKSVNFTNYVKGGESWTIMTSTGSIFIVTYAISPLPNPTFIQRSTNRNDKVIPYDRNSIKSLE